MAVTLVGTTGLNLQPDQSISQAPDGSGEARLSYRTAWNNIQNFLPTPLQPHPIFPALKLYEFTIAQELGNIGRFDCIYRGVLAANPRALYQEEADIITSQEPVETNPLFAYPPDNPPVTPKQLAAIQQAMDNTLDNPDPIKVPPDSVAFTLWLKMRRGIISYYKVQTNYKASYCQGNIPTGGYQFVGTILDPFERGFPNSPAPPLGQDYIFTSFSWRRAGGVVYVNEEFLMSGRGGWDLDLYEITDQGV